MIAPMTEPAAPESAEGGELAVLIDATIAGKHDAALEIFSRITPTRRTYRYTMTDVPSGRVLEEHDRPVAVSFGRWRGKPDNLLVKMSPVVKAHLQDFADLCKRLAGIFLPGTKEWEFPGLAPIAAARVFTAAGFTVEDPYGMLDGTELEVS